MKTNEDNLSENLYQVSLIQQEFITARLKQIGLTSHQARTLNYVSTYPGTIQKKLAGYLGKQDATVTNILKTLEKLDYLYREIPKDNERQKKLFLTDKGAKQVNGIRVIFNDLELQLVSSLEKEEQIILKKLLKKLQ